MHNIYRVANSIAFLHRVEVQRVASTAPFPDTQLLTCKRGFGDFTYPLSVTSAVSDKYPTRAHMDFGGSSPPSSPGDKPSPSQMLGEV